MAPAPAAAQTGGEGVQAGEQVDIIRDGYGVPHVFADTDAAAAYGAGYALAQDRLAQMDLLRHIAKGQFSELLGPAVVEMDKTIRLLTYTEAERERKVERYPQRIQTNLAAYRDGINAWIEQVRADPTKLPLEYATLGIGQPEDWTVTDSIAIADMLVLQFGAGGGDELDNAAMLRALVDTFGCRDGLAAFGDVKWLNDPGAPTTVPRGFDWQSAPTFDRNAGRDKPYRIDNRISLADGERTAGEATGTGGPQPQTTCAEQAGSQGDTAGTLAQLKLAPPPSPATEDQLDAVERGRAMLDRLVDFGSNAQLLDTSRTAGQGTTLQLGAPQVGYFTPQIVVDFGIHGETLDATGMTFAGAGPAVLIGRGEDYAWTTTTGASDGADIYVEQLNPDDPTQYRYQGRRENMECRTETYQFQGAPFEEQQICRTRHGPVIATDEPGGVAYALRMSWFDREKGTVTGFFGYNSADSLAEFATDSNLLMSNHNMFYSDDRGNIGYWHPGGLPLRAEGVDIRLPQDGTGASEWRRLRRSQEVPHAVNPPQGWMANWNNKPAVDWTDGDATSYGPDHKVRDHFTRLRDQDDAVFGDIVSNIRYTATRHHYWKFLQPHLPTDSDDPLVRKAVAELRDWDKFRRDTDGDGVHDSAGVDIADEWLQAMVTQAFEEIPNGFNEIGGGDPDEVGTNAAQRGLLVNVLRGEESSLDLSRDYLNGESVAAFAERTLKIAAQTLVQESDSQDPADWARPMEQIHFTRLNAQLLTDTGRGTLADTLGLPVQDAPVAGSGGPLPGDTPDIDFMDRGTYNHVVGLGPAASQPAAEASGAPTTRDTSSGPGGATDTGPTSAAQAMPATGGGAPIAGLVVLLAGGLLGAGMARRRRTGGLLVVVAATSAALVIGGSVTGSQAQSDGEVTFDQPITELTGAGGVRAGSVIPPGQSGFIGADGEDEHYEDQLDEYVDYRLKPMPFTRSEVEAQAESTETITYPS